MATMIAAGCVEVLYSHMRATPSRPLPTRPSSTSFMLFIPNHSKSHAFLCKCKCSYVAAQKQQQKKNEPQSRNFAFDTAMPASAAMLLPLLLNAKEAWGAGGEFGLLEGRSLALVHPIVMGGLFVYTLWAGYLGWQWRSVRTIQGEINELKKQVKPKEEGAPNTPLELKIKELTEVRKELVKGGYRDRHYNAGSLLLAFGVVEAIGGAINTWLRTGKLFPGPHLFAGAGITALWALAAALVPEMQKGNESARNLHIALNSINVLLFLWQIPTGLEIVLKVFEFTKWP